jgi:hypothetical protein
MRRVNANPTYHAQRTVSRSDKRLDTLPCDRRIRQLQKATDNLTDGVMSKPIVLSWAVVTGSVQSDR